METHCFIMRTRSIAGKFRLRGKREEAKEQEKPRRSENSCQHQDSWTISWNFISVSFHKCKLNRKKMSHLQTGIIALASISVRNNSKMTSLEFSPFFLMRYEIQSNPVQRPTISYTNFSQLRSKPAFCIALI